MFRELKNHNSYKTGLNEYQGLNKALREVLKPVQTFIKDKIYWNDCTLEDSEYKSRDGFIPYSHNFGGIQVHVVIPKCEQYEFGFLSFGECEDCGNAELYPEGDHQCGYNGTECASEVEGHLDASLRIWLKFEGIDQKTGNGMFYLVCAGGNGDAPYFRTKYEETYFEAEFTAKNIKDLKIKSKKHIQKLLKVLGA